MVGESNFPNTFYLSAALKWANAVVMQGGRVIRLLELWSGSQELYREGELLDIRRLEDLLDTQFAEEHFFLIAAGKCLDWLKVAERNGLVNASILDGLRGYADLITDSRNMREHDDEYFFGRGRKDAQPRFIQTATINNISVSSDATCSAGDSNDWYVGHGVNLNKIMAEASILSDHLKERLSEIRKSNVIRP